MWLRSITPEHFGPFAKPTTIELERGVTILTGPNDTGKSSVLEAIRMFCQRTKGQEHHVNMNRLGNYAGSWSADPGVRISAEIEIGNPLAGEPPTKHDLQPGDRVKCFYPVNDPGSGYQYIDVRRGKTQLAQPNAKFRGVPRVLVLRPDATIRSVIDLSQLTQNEDQLLKLAFGRKFVVDSIKSLNAHNRSMRLGKAEETLNGRLKEILPGGMGLKFKLVDIGSEGKQIGVNLIDSVDEYVAIEQRGTGVRRLLSLMGLILLEADPSVPSIVLLDEPETSLHADAQHKLRKALENIAMNDRIQVVYSTHSPSMINPAFPERIRVLSRNRFGEIATSVISKPSYGENFQQVRISLGLTPADSLLYGLVTILVEGETEAKCLGVLLQHLENGGTAGFEGFANILESCHFVCGEGDSISYYCKLAAGQNARPIVFLDGDKPNVVRKLNEECPEVPVISLPTQMEFENLVPPARYIAALAADLQARGEDASEFSVEVFDEWSRTAGLPDRMMFSKRIDRWILERTGHSFTKHAVMEAAIKSTPATEINFKLILPLVQAVKDAV